MKNYYIEINGKIIGVNQDKKLLEKTLTSPELINCDIQETERPLVLSEDMTHYVFADTEEYLTKELAKAKEAKIQEATDKAYSFESKEALITISATNMMSRSSETYHIEATLTNNIKLSAYAQALDESATLPWNTKENVNVLLNKSACTTLTGIMSQMNAKLWTVDFPTILAQIEAAETLEDVEAIEIVYSNPEEVIDVNIPLNDEVTNEDTTGIQEDNTEAPELSKDDTGEVE